MNNSTLKNDTSLTGRESRFHVLNTSSAKKQSPSWSPKPFVNDEKARLMKMLTEKYVVANGANKWALEDTVRKIEEIAKPKKPEVVTDRKKRWKEEYEELQRIKKERELIYQQAGLDTPTDHHVEENLGPIIEEIANEVDEAERSPEREESPEKTADIQYNIPEEIGSPENKIEEMNTDDEGERPTSKNATAKKIGKFEPQTRKSTAQKTSLSQKRTPSQSEKAKSTGYKSKTLWHKVDKMKEAKIKKEKEELESAFKELDNFDIKNGKNELSEDEIIPPIIQKDITMQDQNNISGQFFPPSSEGYDQIAPGFKIQDSSMTRSPRDGKPYTAPFEYGGAAFITQSGDIHIPQINYFIPAQNVQPYNTYQFPKQNIPVEFQTQQNNIGPIHPIMMPVYQGQAHSLSFPTIESQYNPNSFPPIKPGSFADPLSQKLSFQPSLINQNRKLIMQRPIPEKKTTVVHTIPTIQHGASNRTNQNSMMSSQFDLLEALESSPPRVQQNNLNQNSNIKQIQVAKWTPNMMDSYHENENPINPIENQNLSFKEASFLQDTSKMVKQLPKFRPDYLQPHQNTNKNEQSRYSISNHPGIGNVYGQTPGMHSFNQSMNPLGQPTLPPYVSNTDTSMIKKMSPSKSSNKFDRQGLRLENTQRTIADKPALFGNLASYNDVPVFNPKKYVLQNIREKTNENQTSPDTKSHEYTEMTNKAVYSKVSSYLSKAARKESVKRNDELKPKKEKKKKKYVTTGHEITKEDQVGTIQATNEALKMLLVD